MKYLKLIIFFSLTIASGTLKEAAYASRLKLDQNSLTKITVAVKNKNLLRKTLVLTLREDEIYSNVGAKKFEVNSNDKGLFCFVVPNLKKLARFTIYFSNHVIVSEKLLEPGDDIRIEYGGDTTIDYSTDPNLLIFSGKGYNKFNVLKQLESSEPNNIKKLAKEISFDSTYLNIILSQSDSTWVFKSRILNQYKNILSPSVYQTIKADLFGSAYNPSFVFINQQYKDSTKRDVINSIYQKMKIIEFPGDYNDVSKSSVYIQKFLLSKLKSNVIVNSVDNKLTIKGVLDEILKLDNAKLKEKLLVSYLLSQRSTISEKDQFSMKLSDINYALKYIFNPEYKELINNLFASRTKGAQAYVFTMPDTSGKMISLKDFIGKVVLIDCWFTGCTNCAAIAKIIDTEILPRFVNDTNLILLSINVDRDKALWKKSIKSGKYTNAKSINLFTQGLELDHPFIKNYHFQGFPHVMLIDRNGNIFSAEMPRNGNQMITVINEALKNQSDLIVK